MGMNDQVWMSGFFSQKYFLFPIVATIFSILLPSRLSCHLLLINLVLLMFFFPWLCFLFSLSFPQVLYVSVCLFPFFPLLFLVSFLSKFLFIFSISACPILLLFSFWLFFFLLSSLFRFFFSSCNSEYINMLEFSSMLFPKSWIRRMHVKHVDWRKLRIFEHGRNWKFCRPSSIPSEWVEFFMTATHSSRFFPEGYLCHAGKIRRKTLFSNNFLPLLLSLKYSLIQLRIRFQSSSFHVKNFSPISRVVFCVNAFFVSPPTVRFFPFFLPRYFPRFSEFYGKISSGHFVVTAAAGHEYEFDRATSSVRRALDETISSRSRPIAFRALNLQERQQFRTLPWRFSRVER